MPKLEQYKRPFSSLMNSWALNIEKRFDQCFESFYNEEYITPGIRIRYIVANNIKDVD